MVAQPLLLCLRRLVPPGKVRHRPLLAADGVGPSGSVALTASRNAALADLRKHVRGQARFHMLSGCFGGFGSRSTSQTWALVGQPESGSNSTLGRRQRLQNTTCSTAPIKNEKCLVHRWRAGVCGAVSSLACTCVSRCTRVVEHRLTPVAAQRLAVELAVTSGRRGIGR